MQQEWPLIWCDPGARLKEILGQGERAGLRRQFGHDPVHKRREMQSRKPPPPWCHQRAKHHPQNKDKVGSQHHLGKRLIHGDPILPLPARFDGSPNLYRLSPHPKHC